ncbi:conserved Plasmodium protein, unknown function [Plasmodium gallinaceum]|uniref:Thrombospondin-related protein 1 n=1 Tax=Plasmodium gallinaceum TaxID=5849 RepID=A0A1J1GMH4_PLAGA|nr:conserved Plasmodium protein, unknown function [Plasmodium gallinaceum]CRG93453.1 conserved Plasmodium protein, unknown function [Plasmodium gallinaceum]
MYKRIVLKTLFFSLLISCIISPTRFFNNVINEESGINFINSIEDNLLSDNNVTYKNSYLKIHSFHYKKEKLSANVNNKHRYISSYAEYKYKRTHYESHFTNIFLIQNQNKKIIFLCYRLFYNNINYICKIRGLYLKYFDNKFLYKIKNSFQKKLQQSNNKFRICNKILSSFIFIFVCQQIFYIKRNIQNIKKRCIHTTKLFIDDTFLKTLDYCIPYKKEKTMNFKKNDKNCEYFKVDLCDLNRKNNYNVYNNLYDIYHSFYKSVQNKFLNILNNIYKSIPCTFDVLYRHFFLFFFKRMKIKRRLMATDDDDDSDEDIEDENDEKLVSQKFHRAYSKNNTIQYFKCFLDKAADNVNADNELVRWVNPITNSCYCSEENSEPCSTNDITDTNFVSQLMDSDFCDTKQVLDVKNIFIVLSNSKKLHCESSNKVEDISQNDLYNYCKYGLKSWDNNNFYEYMKCNTVKSNEEKNKDECKKKCERIKFLCNENAQFYSFENCKKYYERDLNMRAIYTENFKFFDENCSYFDISNRGLVLCKHKNVDCDYTEWSEWTKCSKSCRENDYDFNALQKRTRLLLKEALYAGKSCSVVVNDNNKLLDIKFCSNLPYCNPNLNVDKEDKIPPFVIPLNEIEKANTLDDLNDDDNELLNENFLSNDSDMLTDCIITDMYKHENSIGYSEKIRSCSCPSYETPCYFKDIYNSNNWKPSLKKLCQTNPNINVLTADYVMIGCDMSISFKKKEVAVNTYLAMTFDCQSSLFQYLFCSKSNESTRTNFIYIIITCIFGGISAIYVIHLIINNSGKFKVLLGLNEKKQLDKHSDEESENEEDDSVDVVRESDKNNLINDSNTSNNEKGLS